MDICTQLTRGERKCIHGTLFYVQHILTASLPSRKIPFIYVTSAFPVHDLLICHPSSPCQCMWIMWMLAVCLVCVHKVSKEGSIFRSCTGREKSSSVAPISLNTHTHVQTQEFCLTDFLSELCVCVNTTGENTRWRLVIPGGHPTVYVVFECPDWLLLNHFSLICLK